MAREGLTPPIINAQPQGLLGLLGLKNGGQNPQQLSLTVSPTIDLWNQYLWSNSEMYKGQVGELVGDMDGMPFTMSPTLPVDLPNTVNVQVPTNELWALLEWDVNWAFHAAPATAQTFDMGIMVQEQNIRRYLYGALMGSTVNATTSPILFGVRHWDGLTYLKPGCIMQYFLYGSTGATAAKSIGWSGQFRICRLRL